MRTNYDMCVDYGILCGIEERLEKIENDLNNSTDQMAKSIEASQGFLAGNQFEKAKKATAACMIIAGKTETNIRFAREYIKGLKTAIEEYGRCGYSEEI